MEINLGIPKTERQHMADGLNRLLADTFTLYLQTHTFHWNVTGPQFDTLHRLFALQYTELWQAVDGIAERIRTLGMPAVGTYAEFRRQATVTEVEDTPAAPDMLRILLAGHEAVARSLRSLFALAEAGHDHASADLLTQRLQSHEKTAWMLRSLLA